MAPTKQRSAPAAVELAVTFESLARADVDRAGGKGANLGELTRAGFPVPPGFVVTAAAYRSFCDGAGLRDRITELLHEVDVDDAPALDEAARTVRALVEAEPVPTDVEDAVRAAYAELADDDPEAPVAVDRRRRPRTRKRLRSQA